MKKYKLIKEYPYSPHAGTIVSKCNDSTDILTCYDFEISEAIVQQYSEFWQEIKEPLFVTEDGKEVLDGESIIWLARLDNIVFSGFCNNVINDERFNKYKIFSTKEAVEKWINDNKPVFSRKQVLDGLEKTFENKVYGWTEAINIFKKELGL